MKIFRGVGKLSGGAMGVEKFKGGKFKIFRRRVENFPGGGGSYFFWSGWDFFKWSRWFREGMGLFLLAEFFMGREIFFGGGGGEIFSG